MPLMVSHGAEAETGRRTAMSKPFDATMRILIELEPAAWLRFLHIPVADPDRVKVIDSNLSTVTAEADKGMIL